MTDEEATANAFSDPDNQPRNDQAGLRRIHVSGQNGTTLLERFRKALEKEKKISLTVRYDADVVHWYKAKGKGCPSAMNAALRAVMESERTASRD